MAVGGKLNEITEFIGLRSKCYSFKTLEKEKSTAKGIVKNVKEKELHFDKFKAVLDTKIDNDPVEQTRIVSKKHQIFTITEMKRNLAFYDEKQYTKDGIHNYPLEYWRNEV